MEKTRQRTKTRIQTSDHSRGVERWPFDAHCHHMGTAIKRPVSDRVKPPFVIFDIRAL